MAEQTVARQAVKKLENQPTCAMHKGKKLTLYCETCEELICLHCMVKTHKDHQYDLISNMFGKHKAEIEASLEPLECHLGIVNKMCEQFS